MKKKNVTIKDIAKLACCTPAAVSMALNNRPGVGAKTKERILHIAKELEYKPNMLARGLTSNRSNTIGLIINNFSDHFFAHMAEGVEKEARLRGYTVFISSIEADPELESMYTDMFVEKRVDGIVFSTVYTDGNCFEKLDKLGLPYVFINRRPYRPQNEDHADYVVLDNFTAGYEAALHLYRLGHDNIGLITGTLKSSANIERTEGAKKALSDNGVKLPSRLVVDCNNSLDKAYRAMEKFINMKNPPTAVFVEDDTMAVGAREAIIKNSLIIPEDIALVGFDDISVSSLSGIELTTIREKEKSMGQLGVTRLINKIEGKYPDATNQTVLKPELIIRKSCGYSLTGYVR